MRVLVLALSAIFALLGYAARAETYFRWTDSQGVVHLANRGAPAGAETVRLPDLPAGPPPLPPRIVQQWDSDRWYHPQPGGNVEHRDHEEYRTWMEPNER